MLELCRRLERRRREASQIRKTTSDSREYAKCVGGARSRTLWRNRLGIGRIKHTCISSFTGNAYCVCQDIKEQAGTPISMLDVLIERVSYDPMAIFIAVAIVLLVMLARTL